MADSNPLLHGTLHRRRHHSIPDYELTDESDKKLSPSGWFGKRRFLASEPGQLLIVMAVFLLFLSVHHQGDENLPSPLPLDAAPERFSELRANQHLYALTQSIGPRPAGSSANTDFTTAYLLKTVAEFATNAHESIELEVELQTPSGSFEVDYRGFLTFYNAYIRVKNVVVRLSRKGSPSSKKHSVLLATHFDSFPQTEGASDSAACVAVLLETLRAFSSTDAAEHSLILVLNGAEEFGLQASHGFIAQHRWASTIRAFINVDAGGVGGPETLLQTGPGNAWIAAAYARAAPHPNADANTQDLFQSGAIPSDTDFRVYAEHGEGIPGLDLAFFKNGYIYHTYKDSVEQMEKGSIQHMGDNVLAVAREILFNTDFTVLTEQQRSDRAVYFTIFYRWVVCVTEAQAVPVQYLLAGVCMALLLRHYLSTARKHWLSPALLMRLLSAILLLSFAFVSGFLSCIVSAFVLSCVSAISWYSSLPLAVTIFSSAFMFGVLQAFHLCRSFKLDELSLLSGQILLSSIILLSMTFMRLSIAYLDALVLLCLLICWACKARFLPCVRYLPHILPLSILYSICKQTLQFFIPAQGRMGALPSDVIVGCMVALSTSCLSFPLLPLLFSTDCARRLRFVPLFIVIASVFVSVLTPVYTELTPKRILIQQTYIESESVSDTYVMSIDNRNPTEVLEAAKEKQQENLFPKELEIISPELVSGHLLALYPLALSAISSVVRFPAPPPPPSKRPTLQLVKDQVKDGRRHMCLRVDLAGSSYGTFTIEGIRLHSWAFDAESNRQDLGGHMGHLHAQLEVPRYFVRSIAGDAEPFLLYLEVDSSDVTVPLSIRMEATSFGDASLHLQQLHKSLPSYAASMQWLSVVVNASF